MIDIKIDASSVADKLRAHIEGTSKLTMQALGAEAKVIQREAKKRAPVRKNEKGEPIGGDLKKSIKTSVVREGDEVVAKIYTNKHYAIHVEYGHRTRKAVKHPQKKPIRWIPGRYFLKGAFDSQKDNAVKVIATRIAKGGRS